jgi:site-specific DNA-methyltransferase (adenine-specific)
MSHKKMNTFIISNSDATEFIKTIDDNMVQCVICDPPFGIHEDTFDKHYARNATNIVKGYNTAPSDNELYQKWVEQWLHEIPRILKPDGTIYIVCAWNHVCDVELAIRSANLKIHNHIIWKYNFGVYTEKKFVSSHYHILRCSKNNKVTPLFNSNAFFNETDKTSEGHSSRYTDMEDVWIIKKEYKPNEKKNVNKLPDALVRKMILYSTNSGDWVADFFLGNFTTAYNSLKEGRKFIGCEINTEIYREHMENINNVTVDVDVTAPKVSTKPKNAGKKLSTEDVNKICAKFDALFVTHNKKESISILQKEYERGYFSILNVLKANNR